MLRSYILRISLRLCQSSKERIMNKKIYKIIATGLMTALMLSSCGQKGETASEVTTEAVVETVTDAATQADAASTNPDKNTKLDLEDGEYLASFDTDGSMFHVNEVYDGKGTLTVKDGIGTLHIVLPSTNTVNLFYGVSEDAKKDGAELIDPVLEEVTYSDGTTEEVNSFDIPVPYLDKEYDIALIGTKGKWYDHKVKVSNVVSVTNDATITDSLTSEDDSLREGQYLVPVTLEGGSGKATIESPTTIIKTDDGYVAVITWSSPHYDYMIVDGEKYLPINEDGNSVFEIPFKDLSAPVTVIADTVAMSEPHEIEYTLTFDMSEVD